MGECCASSARRFPTTAPSATSACAARLRLANLTSEQRAELARRLAGQGGLERVRIEFREGRGITSNEGGRGEAVRADNSARGSGRAERQERPERAARSGGSGRH